MKFQSVTIFVVFFLFVFAFSNARLSGRWNPISNIKDSYVTGVAQFALAENLKLTGEKLSLVEVIKGERKVVQGILYRLLLAAKDGSVVKKYEVEVLDRPFSHIRRLTSFRSLP